MSNTSLGLGEDLQQYLLDVSLHEPAICQRLREQTVCMAEGMMLSSPEQVQLLLLLCKMLNAKSGLEVGPAPILEYCSIQPLCHSPGSCLSNN